MTVRIKECLEDGSDCGHSRCPDRQIDASLNVEAMLHTINNFLRLANPEERMLFMAELHALSLEEQINVSSASRPEGATHSGVCVGPSCDVVD